LVKRKIANLGVSLVGPAVLIVVLTMPIGPLAGGLQILIPWGGLFDVGRGMNEPYEQTVHLRGVSNDVNILIDQFGVPHIYAATVEDAYVGLGFMHAKDRLFQMVIQNRLAAGRVSEIVGGYANSSDKLYRTIGLRRTAEECLEWFEENADAVPEADYALRLMDAQVTGINHFINTMTSENTPIEFKILGVNPEPWTKVDMFLGASMITWGLTGDFDDLTRLWLRQTINNDTIYDELYPDEMPYVSYTITEQTNLNESKYEGAPGGYPAPPVTPATVVDESIPYIETQKLDALLWEVAKVVDPFGMREYFGSNNWAVSGARTESGYPMLCNDAHQPLTAPSLVYEAHLCVPGELNAYGVTLPGMPSIESGFNDYLTWGFTNVGTDVLDIFVEQLNPENANEYFYNGEYRPFETIEETILTKEGVEIPFEVKQSVHGPLIDSIVEEDLGAPNLAMNWTGSGVSHLIMAATQFDKATTMEEFFDAIYWWDNPPFNFAFADAEGNVAMTVCGRMPIRSGYSGRYPVTAINDSVGMVSNIPYAHLPREINPSRGYVTSTNQRPIDPASYNYTLVGPYAEGYRSRRIDELLAADDEISMEDLMRFQADAVEIRARSIVPEIVSAWDTEGSSNATIDQVVDLLRVWDYEMATDIKPPTIWIHLFDAARYEIFDEVRFLEDELADSGLKGGAAPRNIYPRGPVMEEMIAEGTSEYFDDESTPGVSESRDEILVRALHRAVDEVYATYGSEQLNWVYGLHHTLNIEHMAGLTTIEGGAIRGQHTLFPSHGWEMSSGPVYRSVIDLGNTQNSKWVIAGGQSGNLFSPHFDDLFRLYFAYNETSMHFGYHELYVYESIQDFESDVAAGVIERMILLRSVPVF
jgi:penicillin amidase